jgi:hypothetical protein
MRIARATAAPDRERNLRPDVQFPRVAGRSSSASTCPSLFESRLAERPVGLGRGLLDPGGDRLAPRGAGSRLAYARGAGGVVVQQRVGRSVVAVLGMPTLPGPTSSIPKADVRSNVRW